MKDVLDSLVQVGRIDERDCDEILREYSDIVDECATSADFRNFDLVSRRLDVSLFEQMNKKIKYAKLWKMYRILLLLSHGQAAVERGFSVNRHIEVENLSAESYSAQPIICDHVNSIGGLNNISIDKNLMLSVAGARQTHMMSLNEKND